MPERLRWQHAVRHRGAGAEGFLAAHLSEPQRRILLVGGVGFDPRAPLASERLGTLFAGRITALFLREERPHAPEEQARRTEAHRARMQAAVPDSTVVPVRVFAEGSMAVVGGREAVRAINTVALGGVTDILVDLSALSIGIAFPVVRHLVETLDRAASTVNVHVLVHDAPDLDAQIAPDTGDSVEVMAGFRGRFGLDETAKAARLWLPQLGHGLEGALSRIHAFVQPDAVAPILPFPSANPRLGDELIEEFATALESEWQVDARNLIYADEHQPLDLYRTIRRLAERRQRVFEGAGGSMVIVTPSGSKVVALGALLAAVEQDFPVIYVEPLHYTVAPDLPDNLAEAPELVHVWLRGEADTCPEGQAVA